MSQPSLPAPVESGMNAAQEAFAEPAAASEAQEYVQHRPKRQLCPRCSRPLRVCLCAALPEQPFHLHGQLVVLQHPLESKQAFATVPLLRHVMQPCKITIGRELQPHKDVELRQLMDLTRAVPTASRTADDDDAAPEAQSPDKVPLYILYPSPGAVPVDKVASSHEHMQRMQSAATSKATPHGDADVGADMQACTQELQPTTVHGLQHTSAQGWQQDAACSSKPPGGKHAAQPAAQQPPIQQQDAACSVGQVPTVQHARPRQQGSQSQPAYVLLVIDGTWKPSKEMFNKMRTEWLPPNGHAMTITLPFAASNNTSEQLGRTNDQATDGNADQHAASSPCTGSMDKSCLIRKEPVEGFMTTYEATARTIATLEGMHACDGFLETVLAPLKLWTAKQAEFDPCTRERIAGKREEDSEWATTHARMKKTVQTTAKER